jgi:endonuclease/exonuclease/phosphatase (EEP) superfamily protein YafD
MSRGIRNSVDERDAARLVAERIRSREHKEDPVIALGDFNAPRFFRPLRIVASAGLSIARAKGSTFHFDRGINIQPAVDHVLYSKPFEYGDTQVIR